ncbi:scaffold protein Nfu/NifU N terminal-domain-containing protein [Piptocephalis cylindrospora]|uniref:Scaffold protein Nfu/NifU N terminal-domain-containing protein n=1 Tax=Piptocephalis cylindrospora TaxID=1907219 RepID=A0A4P9XZN9_9FUNG|nr:scaffold protein Nfu/NifU N terminal-domain-containing protein [Piptocephalis cylindrospora]|eukprot:RKP11231.1 scaffold protein Nfu/NifU N terminal-domain-containing protein [Piptocephalis cylindrospora]
MFIQTMSTPNEDAVKFIPGVRVLPEHYTGTKEYVDGRTAHESPLARALFKVDGVRHVFLGPDFITITKESSAVWQIMKPDMYGAIMDFFSSGLPSLMEDGEGESLIPEDTAPHPDDTEVVSMVKELLDTRIRPSIQEDGGDIEYRGMTEEGVVHLKLRGACRTCDSSVVTLKNGIQGMLMHYVPEVTGVEQILDEEEEVGMKEFEKLEETLNDKDGQ